GIVVVDEGQFRRLPGAIAVHRAGLALLLGNLGLSEEYARRALDLVPEDDHLGRGGAATLLGLAWWAGGDLEPRTSIVRRWHGEFAAGRAPRRRSRLHHGTGRYTNWVVSVRPCAPTSRHCSLRRTTARRCCGVRRTCTSA